MKKILALLLTVLIAASLVSCKGETLPEGDVTKPAEPIQEEKLPEYPRNLDISSGIKNHGQSFSYNLDLDADNKEDQILMDITEPSEGGDGTLKVTMGDKSISVAIFDGDIRKVYACDLDTKDRYRDIVVITEEGSADPRVQVFSDSDKGLYRQRFLEDAYYDEEGERVINGDNWLGYAVTYYFNVNDDDTLTIEEQTTSTGMWSVYKTYRKNTDGVYEEVRPDKYKILPDFMKGVEEWGEFVSDEEKALWKKGYVMARMSYKSESIDITVGEAFKPLYDDGKNKLYIEKEDGEQGYIDISYENFGDRHDFNPLFFFLAG